MNLRRKRARRIRAAGVDECCRPVANREQRFDRGWSPRSVETSADFRRARSEDRDRRAARRSRPSRDGTSTSSLRRAPPERSATSTRRSRALRLAHATKTLAEPRQSRRPEDLSQILRFNSPSRYCPGIQGCREPARLKPPARRPGAPADVSRSLDRSLPATPSRALAGAAESATVPSEPPESALRRRREVNRA